MAGTKALISVTRRFDMLLPGVMDRWTGREPTGISPPR
jgi:hypothetical protein